jgi:hypothetical protein
MDINSLVSKEDIKKDQEKKAAGGEMSDSRFWRIPDGKSTIRLLPRLENKIPYKTVFSHRYNSNGEKIFATCMQTFGKKDCPICKQSWAMWNKENKEVKDTGYQVRKSPRFLYNCYIVNDPEKPENNGTIKIISVGKKLQDLILESFNSEDLGNVIFDAINGVDFEINRKKSGDNPNFPDYSSSRFVFRKYAVVKNWDAIKDKLINIDELIKEETPEELKEKFKFLGFESTGATTTAPKTQPKPKVEEKKQKPEEEDINIDELEGDNGETDEAIDKGVDDIEDIDIEDELEKL